MFEIKNFEKENESKKDITFIIPSVGRDTLPRTLQSLQNLSIPYWKAIVIFDGISPVHTIKDDRIVYTTIEKVGISNHAGEVRNHGIEMADTTWIGFVDDDDTITPDYLEEFYKIVDQKNPDVIIFRMIYWFTPITIVPKIGTNIIKCGDVGISFCMKKCEKFIPDDVEDFLLLKRLDELNKKIYLSEKVCYHVRF